MIKETISNLLNILVDNAEKMDLDQETTIKAAIVKTAGNDLMTQLPDIAHMMKFLDPYTADLNFLILLEEICKG